jgi:hypothetical protein
MVSGSFCANAENASNPKITVKKLFIVVLGFKLMNGYDGL